MNLNTHYRKKTLLMITGLALGIASSSTLAQVAPPPTKPAKEQPEYKPAPTAAPKPAAKPAAPKPKPAMNASRNRGDIANLPINVPYPKLAEQGPDGRILRLRQLPDIAAMKSNPNIGPKSVEKIMPIVYSRRYRMELKIIDNLDLYWQLTGGLIENMDMSNITEMSQAAEMIKPLIGETTLSQELLNRNILTRVQGGMNQYIVREYKKAITDEIQVLEGEKGLEEVMRFVLEDSIHETINTYNAMLAEALSQIATLVDQTNAQSSEAIAIRALEKPLSDVPIRQLEDIQIFDAAFRKLPYEEAMAIFQAMRENREFPSLSPTVQKIDVLHARKVVSDSGFELLAKDPKTGRVLDTRKRDEDGKPMILDGDGNKVEPKTKPVED